MASHPRVIFKSKELRIIEKRNSSARYNNYLEYVVDEHVGYDAMSQQIWKEMEFAKAPRFTRDSEDCKKPHKTLHTIFTELSQITDKYKRLNEKETPHEDSLSRL